MSCAAARQSECLCANCKLLETLLGNSYNLAAQRVLSQTAFQNCHARYYGFFECEK